MLDDFLNMSNKTELLESVDWDEDEFKKLLCYLSDALNKTDAKNPSDLLNCIELNFGKNTKDVLTKIFNQITFLSNAHLASHEEN